MYVCMYVCIYVCMYVCMYIYLVFLYIFVSLVCPLSVGMIYFEMYSCLKWGIQFFSSVSEHLQPTASVVKSTFGRAHLPCWVQTMETMSLVKLCLPFSCQSLLGRSLLTVPVQ